MTTSPHQLATKCLERQKREEADARPSTIHNEAAASKTKRVDASSTESRGAEGVFRRHESQRSTRIRKNTPHPFEMNCVATLVRHLKTLTGLLSTAATTKATAL